MIDEAVDFLAVYRLTRLGVTDQFPPVRKLRARVLGRWPETDWRVELGTCSWCLSVWIAAGVLLVRRTRAWRALRFVLASSAVAGVMSEKL